ncbi:BACON domain-containing protein [Tenacibaculum soleae]|uniref:BACON domain-containing protein n=1 Tax=Tenacibaculum soleae TaxID=447689 RepID=UPI0026E4270A|nr:hypothetical protein [Tenacibaculum soleae]MDO6813836.1 hypothetical protein [Tenacibaculum soleae]
MSTFTPTDLTINFRKFVTPIETHHIVYNHKFFDNSLFYIVEVDIVSAIPPWLEVVNFKYSRSEKKTTFSVKIKENYVLSMAEGNYDTSLKIRVRYISEVSPPTATRTYVYSRPTFKISLAIIPGVLLNVTPTNLLFNYTIGNSLPSNKIAQIVAQSNWSVNAAQSWVTLSPTTGVGNSSLVIGVDPSSLTVGTYESEVFIGDGIGQETIIVTLVVDEGDTPTNFLYVNPRNLEFVSEFNEVNDKEFNLNLETSNNWSTVISQPWLSLSATSGISGVHNLKISVNSVALAVGVYTGFVEFRTNDIIKKVYVSLKVIAFLEDGITSETLYFAEDLNELQVTNVADNTFLVLDFVTATATNNLPYQKEAPFYKGVATVLIGDETTDLLQSTNPTDVFTSRIINNIAPLNISFASAIENKISGAITPLGQYSNVRFLNGHTPTTQNKLCYTPNTIYVTNKAVLSLSILSLSLPDAIEITGDATATISAAIASNLYTYNAIINLEDLNLVMGNTIAINFGNIITNVIIKEPAVEHTLLAFENEWNNFEIFECTGFFTETIDVTKQTTAVQVANKEHTKITKLAVGYKYTVNTGNMYSQQEKEWLSELLKSKKAFIFLKGAWVAIIMTTKTLEIYKTREHDKSYDLKFTKAIV